MLRVPIVLLCVSSLVNGAAPKTGVDAGVGDGLDKKNEAPFTASDCSVGDSYAYTGRGSKCEAHERNPDSFVSTTCSGATPICAMLQETKRRKNERICGNGNTKNERFCVTGARLHRCAYPNQDFKCVWISSHDLSVSGFPDKTDCLQVTKTASCKSAEDAKAACTEWKKKVSTSESKEYTYECDDGTTDSYRFTDFSAASTSVTSTVTAVTSAVVVAVLMM